MSRQARRPSATGIYHVMIRGINRQPIFLRNDDYVYFLDALRQVREVSACTILAYCCMPNHVHLLLEQGEEPVSLVMKRLGVRYAGWFNSKYGRVGHVFQDRFLSRAVEDDPYLLSVVLYIHFNPVVAGLCEQPSDYPWSSRPTLGHPLSLTNLARLEELIPLAAITEAETHYEHGSSSDDLLTDQSPACRRTDEETWALITLASGTSCASDFQRLAPAEQQAAVRQLQAWDVPMRQVSRLTGLTRGCVSRWSVRVNQADDPGTEPWGRFLWLG